MASHDTPKITIATVTYNAEKVIGPTMESVLGQTYPNKEYILVDGASTDGTCEVIRSYGDELACFLSEPDQGTYDAMNKAIDAATGEWIIFINAGDYFIDNEILARVYSRPVSPDIDFIYGDYIWKGEKNQQRIASRPLETMWQRICFSHQSLFTRTRLMKERKFDLRYRIVSDYHFYFSCYMEGARFLKMDFPISVFTAGGLSDVNFLERTMERWKVVTCYKRSPKIHLYYLYLLSRYWKNRLLARWRSC